MLIKVSENRSRVWESASSELLFLLRERVPDSYYAPVSPIQVKSLEGRGFRLAALSLNESGRLIADLLPAGHCQDEPHFGFDLEKLEIKSIDKILKSMKHDTGLDAAETQNEQTAPSLFETVRTAFKMPGSLRSAAR